MFSYWIKRMKGLHRMTEPTITTRVDHIAEMRRAINAATSAAEDAGVSVAAIHEMFKSFVENFRQRSLYETDRANARAQAANEAVARANAVRASRAERQLQAEREAYRAAVNRAADAQAERDGYAR
jgi:hypothetical protein